MKPFQYFQPTEIRFGRGTVEELGEVTARFGRRALLVTDPAVEATAPTHARVLDVLKGAGIDVTHFDGVIPIRRRPRRAPVRWRRGSAGPRS